MTPAGRCERVRSPGHRALVYQEQALPAVSRTFALTLPQLPPVPRSTLCNAYLLCRIADTIEDEPALSDVVKARLLAEFAEVVAGRAPAAPFVSLALPLLSPATAAAERDLLAHAELVLEVTHAFPRAQRDAIEHCLTVMTTGMAEFGGGRPEGLATRRDLERYTYCVAGVVGETVTALLCDYSAEIAARRDRLGPLAADFGRGLQLVNILKDVWEDRARGACWLPREAFAPGVDLASPDLRGSVRFADGLGTLVAVARGYLDAAFEYTLLIPAREAGVRRFLLWTLGLAVLTLRRIYANPWYRSGAAVKVPRWAVRALVAVTSGAAGHDAALRWLYRRACAALPPGPRAYVAGDAARAA